MKGKFTERGRFHTSGDYSMLEKVKRLAARSKKITLLTGAGISTESGISDFRSPGGVWSRYRTVTIQEFLSSAESRRYYWAYKRETIPPMLESRPNTGHYAIAELDRQGRLFRLLTQNIDGLHERAGVRKNRVVNLHGTNHEAVCLSCERIFDIREILLRIDGGDTDPVCELCGGYIKPNTVSFGQTLKMEDMEIADRAARQCDLFMALGSSLRVSPACGFVEIAHASGRPVVIINREATPCDSIARYRLEGPLAEILPVIFHPD